jgi:hypothetical protein
MGMENGNENENENHRTPQNIYRDDELLHANISHL